MNCGIKKLPLEVKVLNLLTNVSEIDVAFGRTTMEKQSSRREVIIREASELFSQKGYQATGMRELAVKVGIEPASIYSHFISKEGLLWEIADICAQSFDDAVRPVFQSDLSDDQKLREMILKHVEVTLENRDAAAVFTHEWRQLGDVRRTEYAEKRRQYEGMFRETIEKGTKTGRFQTSGVGLTTLTILSALNFTARWYKPGGELTPQDIGNQLADLLLNGLIAR